MAYTAIRVNGEDEYRQKMKERFAKARAELERRRHHRIDAKVPVTFANASDFVKAYTENISKGGIYFETTQRLSPNGRLELSLAPPGSLREVKVMGRVTRMSTRHEEIDGKKVRIYGYGVRFEDLPAADRKVLDRFFQRAIKSGAKETPVG